MNMLATASAEIAITGWSIHIPGFPLKQLVRGDRSPEACPPERAHELLGRKGLLYKEPATRLGLCAVHRTLNLEPKSPRPEGPPDPHTAVVVSSNFGNVATVQKIVTLLQTGTVRDVSPLDAPNASSNIIASTIAIWFRFGGPNIMVCSGANSGLDAISIACTLLRARRARRVMVVGVEPDDETAVNLYNQHEHREFPLRSGAAALLLQPANAGGSGHPVLGTFRQLAAADVSGAQQSSMVIGPGGTIDVMRSFGDMYGALGIVQIALGAAILMAEPAGPISKINTICGNSIEGWRSLAVTRLAAAAKAAAN